MKLRKPWLLVVMLLLVAPTASTNTPTVRIAVLAHRGEAEALAAWTPTAEYLSRQIPSRRFVIVPLKNQTLPAVIAQGGVDFVITNPGSYAGLEASFGVTRMLTLRNLRQGKPYTQFGAVIFTRSNRDDIKSLANLRGKSFMGVGQQAFGGYQMAWLELKQAGINPSRDFKPLLFSGLPQDQIVYAVRDGKVDAGTVRTDTLERMSREGKIRLSDFKVINQQSYPGFPFQVSTRLYPEWAFARLTRTDENLAQQVVVALLQISPDSRAARASQSFGWTVPLDYTPVHELLKELRLGPYKDFGKIDLATLVSQYWHWFLAVFGVFALLVVVTGYILRINQRLKLSQLQLLELTRKLEDSNKILEQLSYRDGLTGVANRRHFDEILGREWLRAERAQKYLSLLMIDIDLFKKYNDHFGHLEGDQCLRRVANALGSSIRRPSDLVARYGGEEFSIILPETDIAGAEVVAEKLRRAIEQLHLGCRDQDPLPHITISVGVASMTPTRGSDPRALIEAADGALYRAKQAGRNRVMVKS